MARNADLRKLLQQKLGVGRAQLYNRAEKIANSLSIKTSDAILVLAAKSHINLQKHGIASAKLEEIRKLLPHVSPVTASVTAPSASSNGKRGKAKSKKGFKVKLPDTEDDPILAKSTHNDMELMVPVYKILYQLENSIRQFIARVLLARHGKDWWEKLAPSDLKKTYASHTKAEEVNAWHQRRSKNPIDYLDFNQLPALVRAARNDFVPAFFRTEGWFQNFVDELYQSRCVVCHMNPLTQTNVDFVGVRYTHWENLVKEKIQELRKFEGKAPSTVEAVAPIQPAVTVELPSVAEATPKEVSSDISSKPSVISTR
jgi:hypothetical protein